ncbi:protein translocase subunit SecD [Hydromonas duriensis]|uniref:Protein translocase subunit SecD n=1 Tax=Hydromonas duriensis TaxID=1527608 RepID=A0A4R6Y6Q3_9BURK|nr:protein translocase subunit SecD [Hydromonas duriensis]TDR30895.1 preprotein translocase subunit SecD [Hydromonas duriensis]
MNRYPLWKYIVILVVLLFGLIYTAPNFFGEVPAVQVSASKSTVKVTSQMQSMIEQTLAAQNISNTGVYFSQNGSVGSFRIRFKDTDTQLKAKEVLNAALNPNSDDPQYIVALNLMSNSPNWLSALGARPMALGLDLRGGVHFLLEVKMDGAIQKRLDSLQNELTLSLKDKRIIVANSDNKNGVLTLMFDSPDTANNARGEILKTHTDLNITPNGNNLDIALTEVATQEVKTNALKQNISTLHNRVNELGVAEPVVQQQGADRIVVELPGVQDTAKAKDLIGRTATLQMRLVETGNGFNNEKFKNGDGEVVVKKQVIVSGDSVTNATVTFTQENQPAVSVTLDSAAGKVMRQTTHDNLKKPMAILLFEKGKGEAISVSTIQGEFGDSFQITGSGSAEEANDLAVLLRAGALAAPMEIINERTVGPSLGADNIDKGFNSLKYGFLAVALFMLIYYRMFGVFSVISLGMNLLLLIALLSWIGATMTLPGIAAIALTLGMAIDSNVLINERVREELRNGATPKNAIMLGYDRAFATILDSNFTTLIAGLALLLFGSGPIKGFAVVHCLGILTSMFSAVFFSRGLVNLWYGRRARLASISIGQVWRAEANTDTAITQVMDEASSASKK